MAFRFNSPVVVRSPNWLGDAIMAFPAVRNLKKLLGDKPLVVATPAKLKALWELCPFVDRVLAFPEKNTLFAAAALLRKENFGCAVLLPNSLRSALEAKLAKIPSIAGYRGHARRWFLTEIVESVKKTGLRHQQYFYLDLMKRLGAPDDDSFPSLKRAASSALSSKQVSLCPGAEYGPAKRWLPERYTELAERLRKEQGASVTLLGAPKDRGIAALIEEGASWVENKVGKTSLEELIAEMRASRLVVSNDSGAMHLASALGVPTVGIFGSTEPGLTGPLGSRTQIIRHHVPCSPCFLRTCPLDFACMELISVDQVFHACREALGTTSV